MSALTAPTAEPTPATTSSARTYRDYSRPLWKRIVLTRESAVIALLVIVWIGAVILVPHFGTPITVTYLLRDIAPVLMIALPMTLVIVTGEIDLSVASVMGLSSVLVGLLTAAGWPVEAAALVAILAGILGGALNGFLVAVVGLPSLAVTIGTLALYRGLAVGLLGTTAVTKFPQFWTDLVKSRIPGTPIPAVTIVLVLLIAIFAIVLHFTSFGRGVYAIGLSKDAAAFSGVRVARTKFILFILTGSVSALAGIYYTLLYTSARGDNATGVELSVIAAVLLGGVSIFGGRGALHGVVAGVLLIGALASALRLAGVTSDVIGIITGTLLVLSVLATSFLTWLQRARSGPRKKQHQPDTTKEGRQ